MVVAGFATKPAPQCVLVLPPSGLPQVVGVQHSLPFVSQAAHLVVAALAKKPALQWTLALPHVFGVQHSSRLQVLHSVVEAFAV